MEVGTDKVAALSASESSGETGDLTALATPGTYYYGACVDAVTDETDTTNNCSTAVAITVQTTAAAQQGRPDLMVASPTVSHGSPSAGARFTLSATVRNGGGGASAATTLRYYRSADASISTSDTEVATGDVAELAAAGSTSASVSLTAEVTPGTYYYGACVDPVTDETDAANNCSASVRITIAILEPDLVVGSPSVSDSGPAAGAQFTLSATVRNDGSGAAGATTLRYYRSPDETITTSDARVGTGAVARLAGSGSSSQSVDLAAPATPGTYYYGACVDAVTDEPDTTNNCSPSISVTVQQTVTVQQGDPDLTVTSADVSDRGPAAGAPLTLSATVANGGAGGAEATTLRYYRSSDAAITAADTAVGSYAIAGLAAAGSASGSARVNAPQTPGTYYYGACVDAVTDETDTTNNCSTSVPVTVPQPAHPDLMVTSPDVSDHGPAPGGPFTLSASVRNGGNGDAPATTLRYYRSADAAITTSDTQVGTDAVAALGASGSASQSVDLTAPSTPGTYYYGACVDAVSGESDTANNCSAAVMVATLQPDLVVGTPAVVSVSNPEAGAQFTLTVTVQNIGDGQSDATTLRYYSSSDSAITASDTPLDTDAVAALAAAGSSRQSVDLTAPATPGTYYYGACVNAVTDESATANNCSTSVAVTVPEAQQQEASSVEISAEDDKIWAPVGDTVDLSARVLDDDGEEVTGTTVTWSSSDTTVATVSSSGVMTAVGEGVATLTATVSASSSSTQSSMAKSEETVSASVDMEVVKRASRVEIAPASLSFDSVGETKTLTATVYDQNDNVMDPKYSVWSSADTDVVAVPWYEGSVQALGAGTTTVSVTVNASATGSARATVTLTGARVTVSPATWSFESYGETKTITVKVLDENGDEDEDASFEAISSYDPVFSSGCESTFADPMLEMEEVDGDLEITVHQEGSGEVEVRSEGVESALIFLVVNQIPATGTLAPDSADLEVGETVSLSGGLKDANGNDIAVATGICGGLALYWSTSDSAVATVDGENRLSGGNTGGTAEVTAVAAGTATVTARWAGNDVTGTATITVTDSN